MKSFYGRAGVGIALFALAACSHASVGSSAPGTPKGLPPLTTRVARPENVTARGAVAASGQAGQLPGVAPAELSVTDLDAPVPATHLLQAGGLPIAIVNGSRLSVNLTAPGIDRATIVAASRSQSLVAAGDGTWRATVRYVDTSNPPSRHPLLRLILDRRGADEIEAFPLVVAHD